MAFKINPPYAISNTPIYHKDMEDNTLGLANNNGTCYVETIDAVPKIIENCDLISGDEVTIKFGKDLAWATIVNP